MNILFISKYTWPHVGGVEKHIEEISICLKSKGCKINSISEKDIKYPHIKGFGLIYIWYWLYKNKKLIINSDIVHIHDVFIWYLPFRFIYPHKLVYMTFHGWEGKYLIPFWNYLNKRIANRFTNGSISIGRYIEKYYKIKSNFVLYGGVKKLNSKKINTKIKNSILYLGRLEIDTGLLEFLKWLKSNPLYKVTFVGEGTFKNKCRKYGKVLGNCDPKKYLKENEYCVPSGYLSFLEAKNFDCKILTFANNPLKTDYWNEIKNLKNIPTWDDVSKVYLKLWKINLDKKL